MQKIKPLVTIGIPAYNRPQGLKNTLQSITDQTYKNLEIIISDNGSATNEIQNIAEQFALTDSRIKFFRQPYNKGVFFNFNFVLENATGDYFMWAADDDEWDTTFIEEIIPVLGTDEKIGLGFSDFSVIVNNAKENNTHLPELLKVKNCITVADKVRLALQREIPSNLMYGIFDRKICAETYKFMIEHDMWKYFAPDQIFNFLIISKTKLGLSNKLLFRSNVNADSLSLNWHKGITSEISYRKGLLKAIRKSKLKLSSKVISTILILKSLCGIYYLIFKSKSVKLMIALNLHKYYKGVKSKLVK